MPLGAHAQTLRASKSTVQEMTINGGTNIVLTSNSTFTAFSKAYKITVNLTGTFNGSTTSIYGFNCGDLSTWTDVDIVIASGCNIRGDGGNGGAGTGGGGTGGGGGTALNVNSANSTGILSIVNNGTISGGGGGGGGGKTIAYTDNEYSFMAGTCTPKGSEYAGGGGGGGGRTALTASSGGSPGLSTKGGDCNDDLEPTAGVNGSSSSGGSGGARGWTKTKLNDLGGTCSPCVTNYGTAGGAGGSWGAVGTAGASGGGAGGAAGKWCINRDHASWPSGYGTVQGGYGA